ncbi:hypothetical protein PQX77_020532 [Marasmius sp. AFHP31]|nr:hypothetical protein PQX77_020532 [Marasmius sp. AFHP31]
MSKYDLGIPLTSSPSMSELEVSTCREIVHELAIVSFWYQLTALDRVAGDSMPKPSLKLSSAELAGHTAEHHTRRSQLIQTVFGASTDPFAASNWLFVEGFAAATWSSRVMALLAFWRLMNTWLGDKGPLWSRSSNNQLAKLPGPGREWETALIRFYVQSYFNHFGHAPVLPRST